MRSQSITRKLIYSIILFSSCVTLFLTAIQLYNDYRTDVGDINHAIDDVELGHLGAIASNVWLDDIEELKLTLNGISGLPEINYIAIHIKGKEYVASGKRVTENVITKTIPIDYFYNAKTQKIGELYIEASLAGVYQRLINRFWLILASNAFKTFLVAIFIFLLVERILITKLKKISIFINSHDTSNFNNKINYIEGKNENSFDEIDEIANALNKKQLSLETSFNFLKESEGHARLLLNSTSEAIYGIDIDGNCTFVNLRCMKTLGYESQEDLLGKNMYSLLHHLYSDSSNNKISERPTIMTNESGETTQVSIKIFWRKNGTSFPAECTISPVMNHDVMVGAIITFRDITKNTQANNNIHNIKQ